MRWDARTLDIDLLAYGNLVLPQDHSWLDLAERSSDGTIVGDLVLPHPRIHDRAFVLTPLSDLVPTWRHPVLEKTVTEMLGALPAAERAGVQPFFP